MPGVRARVRRLNVVAAAKGTDQRSLERVPRLTKPTMCFNGD